MRQEFETLSQVKSTHCAHVLGWESRGDDFALVLEWVDGPTLFDLANTFALSRELVQEIVAQIHQGLHDLQVTGLHHGDLHPRNIMLDSSGLVRLVDFSSGKLSSNQIQGAPAFLAPEIWKGAPTCFETDLFALGVVEAGLKNGFQGLPNRAKFEERGWTAENPKKRSHKKPLPLSADARLKLRDLVASYLRGKNPLGTQRLEIARHASPKPMKLLAAVASAAIWLLAMMTLTLPVRAEAPLAVSEIKGRLKVQSQNWLEVSLNGQKLGFAPLTVNELRPGPHKMKWKSASGSGDFVFEISPGETYSVSEPELRKRMPLPAVKR